MAGAATQLAGVVTSFVILLTLLFLTPIFTNLPKFVLAAIVINSVIPLVAYEEAITVPPRILDTRGSVCQKDGERERERERERGKL